MPALSIAEIADRFPDFRVAFILAEGLAIQLARSDALRRDIAAAEADCRARWVACELSAIPGVAAWRIAYKGFGVKKTSYRSSVERLIKRVLAGQPLPEINNLVDLYNRASLTSGLCLGCDDLDRTDGALSFRYSRPDDTFLDMGAEAGENADDPPKPGEVVYADARHVLCRRWNWRQDMRTAASPQTRRAILTVQGNGVGDVEGAARALAAHIARECGGASRIVMLERTRPEGAI